MVLFVFYSGSIEGYIQVVSLIDMLFVEEECVLVLCLCEDEDIDVVCKFVMFYLCFVVYIVKLYFGYGFFQVDLI